jgi:large subunit ribosomal protein L25
MAEAYPLEAQKREKLGTSESRRLRGRGLVPGNVYGHKEGSVAIAVPAEVISSLVHEGHKIVDLHLDGGTQTTVFREVQWDTFGQEILHFDLLRVDPNERIWVEVPVVLRGISPGVVAGGVLDLHTHTLPMEVRTLELPDEIRVRITDLNIGGAIRLNQLELPPSATVDLPPDTIIVQVLETIIQKAPTEVVEAPAEGAEGEAAAAAAEGEK